MKVSITLLTRHGMATLPALLAAVDEQQTRHEVELVAVDSGSFDGTAELLEKRANRYFSIDPRSFNHGTTRNQAIELGSGEVAVLLVQDAIPASPSWLDSLLAPIEQDNHTAGVFARQLPHPGATALTRWNLARWTGAQPDPWVSRLESPDALAAMQPLDRMRACTFDNVCSCVRKALWQQHPFEETPIAEDLAWAREVLLAGHTIAYQPSAEVYHSHERSIGYEFERTRAVHRRLYELFGLRTIPTVAAFFRAAASTITEHLHVVMNSTPPPKASDFSRAIGLAVTWPLGQYLGGRDGQRAGS